MHYNIARILGLAILVVTGFAGLVYEVTWHRYFANLFGSASQATAMILAVFLGGISIGYAIFGRISKQRSSRSVTRILGYCELGIGVCAIFFPTFYGFVWSNINLLPSGDVASFFTDFVIACLLMGLPTVLMGGTLPLITQGLSANLGDSSVFHARAYSLNAWGAFIGSLAAGFYFIPHFGLPLTVMYLGMANILAGIIFLAISARLPDTREIPSEQSEQKAEIGYLSIPRGSAIGFLAGFYGIFLQTILIRMTGLAFGSSEYAFSVVVGVYIAALSIGSWLLVNKPAKRWSLVGNQVTALLCVMLLYLAADYLPYVVHHLRIGFANSAMGFYLYQVGMFFLLMVVLIVPIGAFGRTMPLIFSSVKSRFDKIGSDIGVLYSWNTVGCVFGAVVGGYFLFFAFDLDGLFKINILLILSAALLCVDWKNLPKIRVQGYSGLAVGTVVVALLLPAWSDEAWFYGVFRAREETPFSFKSPGRFNKSLIGTTEIKFYKDGPNASVGIGLEKNDGSMSVVMNGKSDGNTSIDYATMAYATHLPMMFSERDSNQVAVIGYGTGVSVGEFLKYDEIEKIDIYEISSTLKDASYLLDPYNGNASENERVEWIVSDAYRGLIKQEKKYDVILSEPSNPWVAGIEKLFSQELYEIVSNKLTDNGVYMQWTHMYASSPEQYGMILRTLTSVFPEVSIFHTGGDILMVAKKTPITDQELLSAKERFKESQWDQLRAYHQLDSFEKLLGREVWLPVKYFANSELHTLQFPKLAHKAGRDFFIGERFDVRTLTNELPVRPFYVNSFESLLSRYAKISDSDQFAVLARGLPSLCEQGSKTIAAHSILGCRQIALELFLQGKLKSQFPGLAQEFKFTVDSADAAFSLADYSDEDKLSWLRSLVFNYSPKLKVDTAVVRQKIETCFEGVTSSSLACRAAYSELLALSGDVEAAITTLTDVTRESETRQDPNLIRVLRSARKTVTSSARAYEVAF